MVIDVGNTSTHFGIFQQTQLVKEWRVATERISELQNIKRKIAKEIKSVVVSSVVPGANRIIRKIFPKARFVSYQNLGVKIKLKKPSQIGTDRLVNALAARELYGGPAIIVDFGTATTFDVISKQGEYLGGAIAPGVLLARDLLYERTAKLPWIKIAPPSKVIGRSTQEALRSGLVFGYVALTEGMVERLKKQLRAKSAKVIATGGLAKLICKYTRIVDKIDPKLTLKGLKIAGERWQKN
ncbi:MAG: type III pantothenate kinase [Candidatus Margulisiibacteriota bacterium]